MTDLLAGPADRQDVVENPGHVVEAVSQPPVVITEQEVVFSTAAAVSFPPAVPARGVLAALRAMFPRSSGNTRAPRRHYPPRRDSFLEQAALTREMRRP